MKLPSSPIARVATVAAACLLLLLVAALAAARVAFHPSSPPGTADREAVSADGAIIAYEQTGSGPPLLLIGAALSDRIVTRRLAAQLAPHFTVINYDRRGRGGSASTQPFTPDAEFEDIAALIDAHGGSAFLFGSSSGAVLALEAANKLAPKVKGLYLFEPPFLTDNTWPPVPADLNDRITALTGANRRDEAVRLFFTEAMSIPAPATTLMSLLMPGWDRMTAMAHTLHYDLSLLAGLQSGNPLPRNRWNAAAMPVTVAAGSRSEPFFHSGAKALAAILPRAQYKSLEGLDHSAVLFSAEPLADSIVQSFR